MSMFFNVDGIMSNLMSAIGITLSLVAIYFRVKKHRPWWSRAVFVVAMGVALLGRWLIYVDGLNLDATFYLYWIAYALAGIAWCTILFQWTLARPGHSW